MSKGKTHLGLYKPARLSSALDNRTVHLTRNREGGVRGRGDSERETEGREERVNNQRGEKTEEKKHKKIRGTE